jgi:alkylation response protein AidB-like acyl-CoA dehydrogenase
MYFTEEHNAFRQSFRDFLQKEVVPFVDEWEEQGKIDPLIWKKMGEMGYFGLNYPAEYGGLELDLFYTIIFLEELQRVNSGGFAAAMWAHTYLAMTHLDKEGDEALKQKYLVPSILGEKVGCLCISEPSGGSDVAGMRTTAIKKGDHYILNGSKTFITNGVYSNYLIVAAKTNPQEKYQGISIFVIDREAQGISSSKLNKLGWRASDTGEIGFDNVAVPVTNLLGEEGKGFSYIMQHFALERLVMGVNAHARAEFALEYTLSYMSERETFGKKINQYQALRHKVAEMASEIEMCKEFNYATAKKLNDNQYVVKECTMSKLISTKIADEVIYNCLQFLGGYGYMEDYPLARMFRDSRIGPIGGGTSEILKEIIAKIIIDKKDYKPVK